MKKLHTEYRKDWRNDEEYAKDIADGHKAEKVIIEAYAEHLRKRYGIEVIVEDNGVDNSGKVIDNSLVNSDADYILNGKLIEVKFINNMASEFRIKKDQLHSYVRQDAVVLFVNGYNTDTPKFTLIKPDRLVELSKTRRAKPFRPWGNKMCYFLNTNIFNWFDLAIDKSKK